MIQSHTPTTVTKGVVPPKKIADLHHPAYAENLDNWIKWRLTYGSGDKFINKYLEKFTKRESDPEFTARKKISYVPAFAKSAINEVKDAIFQRIADVTRSNGPPSYLEAVKGQGRGVDLKGCTMNSFVGRHILPDLLSIGKIGVFVDMPTIDGPTLASKGSARPYIYEYKAEDIINWVVDDSNSDTEYQSLLLRDYVHEVDEDTGLPIGTVEQYRLLRTCDGVVLCQFFDKDSNAIGEVIEIDLPTIPFHIFDIHESLLNDVANYQIALLNLASSDVSYALRSNFPFYVEQYSPKSEMFNRPASTGDSTGDDGVSIVRAGSAKDADTGTGKDISVGTSSGRRYPKDLDAPQFIHPSPEPLMASMAKQDELKADIRHLVKLAVSELSPKMASAESKQQDNQSLEAGLSAIGMVLEHGERIIARYWTMYEDRNGKQPTISYPQRYALVNDKDRRDEAKELRESAKSIPSKTYRKEAIKKIAEINLGTAVSDKVLATIGEEIDNAAVVVVDPDVLKDHVELGILDLESASQSVGYPAGSVAKAAKEHAERVARIAESQEKARGVADLGGSAPASQTEKQETATDDVVKDTTRGKGK